VRLRQYLRGLVALLLAAPAWAGLPAGIELPPSVPVPPPAEARDALVFGALRFYKSAEANRTGYEQLIGGLRSRGVNVYPRVVLGSYLDLVDWITRGRIDLAWLPPLSYVQAAKQQPALEPLATVLRRGPRGQITDSTISLLVMRKGERPSDLKQLTGKRIVFGAELSTSGFLLPLNYLLERGVPVREPYTYAGSQQQAIEMLLGTGGGAPTADVIGVSELTFGVLPPATLDRLEVEPVVDSGGLPLRIPNDALVARAGLDRSTYAQLREALLALGEGKPGLAPEFFASELGAVGFKAFDSSPYAPVTRIADALLHGNRYSIRGVLDSIRWDIELKNELARMEGRPYTPRIALVLSGGGAAGCFQAGAAMEVCRAMSEVGMKPDIVVGTSVGAINGTAVAMGHPEVLERFWTAVSLDGILSVRQEDRPMGRWKVWLIQAAQRAPALVGMVLLLLVAYLEVLVFVWALTPLRLSAWAGLGVVALVGGFSGLMEGRLGAPAIVTLAALAVAHGLVVRARSWPPATRWRSGLARLHALALGVALLLVPAELHRAFGEREALFATDGLYRLLGRFFLELQGKPLPSDDETLRKEVTEASAALVKKGLPYTLVISTTDYHRQTGCNFYLTNDEEVKRRGKERGYLSIEEQCPGNLLDVVVASAAVFPVLEPCRINLKEGHLRLIDGGFVHNNPVQVAVDLGATHVLILKPSTDQEYVAGEPSLLSSLFSFFGWLIARSQTEDLRAKDEVMSFLVSPTRAAGAPVIGPLEFDGHWKGSWGLDPTPSLTLLGFLEAGRGAVRSTDRGFQLWSRGSFKLPPAQGK